MDFYDEATRETLAAIIAVASTGALTVISVKWRERGREKRRKLRRHY